MPKSTDITRGWYPAADRIGIPDTNFGAGNMGRKAICIHIMDGTMLGTIARFTNKTQRVSSHFAIDLAGHIKQFVSVVDTSYANGLTWSEPRRCWIDPASNALKAPNPVPTWELLTPPTNPNFQTISIELEGKANEPHPAAMMDACVDLLHWLADKFSALRPYTVPRTLIGHRHIAPKHRANCPGPFVDLEALALAANGPVAHSSYIVAHACPISETPTAHGPVALAGVGELVKGEVVAVDEVRPDGFCHLASGVGFVMRMCLERQTWQEVE